MKRRLADALSYYPQEWRNELLEEFEDLTDPDNPKFHLVDGTPFLSRLDEVEEIPF